MDKFYRIALEKIKECKENGFRHLDLSYLCLSKLPIKLFELTNLYSLNLKGNYLFEIPDEIENLSNLRELDISYNFLEYFGASALRHLTSLQELICESNPFLKDIPVEIRNRPVSEFIDYFSYLHRSTTTRLHECKIIFVGYGEVGKTTLMKKLITPEYRVTLGEEPTTHGINIQRMVMAAIGHDIDDYDIDDDFLDHYDDTFDVDINLWDFGGQEIYHATHQFFLAKRSVYIFVWEARKEEDYFQFEYWLNIIKYLSDSSPVIVVMNKSDVRIKNIDEQTLKRKYSNIRAFLKVSCYTNEGLSQFSSVIEKTVVTLKHLNDVMPRTWKKIRSLLESKSENYISVEEYYSICNYYVLDKKQADSLSEYYHDLGVILHFSKDSLLRKTVILNPEWATQAVYNLLDNEKIIKQGGRFNFDDLDSIWNPEIYPSDKHLELIRLMEKFELIFNLNGTTHYIVPELLESGRPAVDIYNFKQCKLKVEFRYDFMPAGIVSRLLCRLHHLIPDKLYWKDGVVLEYENSETLITSERINRKLIICINGDDASSILSIIRHELSIIHKSLNLEKEQSVVEMVPCNCSECRSSLEPYFYSYSVLKKFLLKGKEIVLCNKSAEDVGIDNLLNGYEVQPRDNDLIYYVLNACSKLQGHHKIIDSKEDSRNEYIASIIDSRYIAKDQARWGKSQSGKSEGELDIKIVNQDNLPISVFEAFTLYYFDAAVIKKHLEKIAGYDPNGFRENYVVIYSESKDFMGVWYKYINFLKEIHFKYPLLEEVRDISERFAYTEMRIGVTFHERNEQRVKLYHIFLNLYQ